MENHSIDETLVPGHTSLEPARPRPRPRLTWTDGKGRHEVELREAVTAGSVMSAQLVVDDRAVSRVHAQLTPKPDGLWVRDLGSRNGTFIGDVAVLEARVPPGGVVRMGQTEITVSYGAVEVVGDLWPEKSFGQLLGRTAVMRELFAQLDRYARSTAAVLITGESGTGKELVARALHDVSPRSGAPMVVVDCAALPPNLLESELFGHARGAFTGALSAHVGAFEAANGGTVFLDEVGELPLALQPKLLRVLESKVIRRLGETAYRKVDIRVISATHRDLKLMVNQRAFREDLFFRLAVLPVGVPPFRERIADLPVLLEAFLGERVYDFRPATMALLAAQPWTGNVRELRNFAERVLAVGVDRACALTFGEAEAPDGAGLSDPDEAPTRSDGDDAGESRAPEDELAGDGEAEALAAVPPLDLAGVSDLFDGEFKPFRERWGDVGEREYLRRLMLRTDHGPTRAAKAAGLNRTYLYRLLRRHKV
jgi:transcriptional regulator with GAF, ATPase, and Fis domain